MAKTRGLKPARGITPEKALKDMLPPPCPRGVLQARWNKAHGGDKGGAAILGWYRGHQAGIHDAYKTIKTRYPRVAKQLLEAYEMNEDGAIVI